MPEENSQPLNLQGEYVEHLHLLSSEDAGWQGMQLIYEQEPPGEMPETVLAQHMLVICEGDVQVDYKLEGGWQKRYYTVGDIIIFPVSAIFPRVRTDREVGLIELFIEPETINKVAWEKVDTGEIELKQSFKLRDPLIRQMGLALKTELAAGGPDSKLYAESMVTALSVHLLRHYSYSTKEIKSYPGGLPKSRLKEAIAYIREHLDRNLSLNEMAATVQMSSHYFASLFKASTGIPPHQYLTKCRIEKAKQLLANQDLSIVEVCHQVGFQNQSHFTRVFRQHTKTTPKVYRKSRE